MFFMVLMAMMMAVGVVGPAGDGERLVQVLCELGSRRQNRGVSHSDPRLLLSRSKVNWNSVNTTGTIIAMASGKRIIKKVGKLLEIRYKHIYFFQLVCVL